MRPVEREISAQAARHLLRAEPFRPSVGLSPGAHWRNGTAHLVHRDGAWYLHHDRSDPWRDPIGHVLRDIFGLPC